ncbi:MAG: hypothetical protein H6624_17860 [Bdellovibrionaceae bacterium]|nr:hypothetical protein [Bdellovibrionales bacterium]MCB9086211.1 hypothetical protein [Pseudobdellovibrionaceae bacterium]
MKKLVKVAWASVGIALAFVISTGLLVGCATFDRQADHARSLIRNRKADQVIAGYKEKAWKESDDQLVYLFDYGTAAHISGQYEESNRALLLADKLSEVKDYHSLSRITGSLLLNEGMVQYKGDDYEKVLVNAVLALNFLMLNEHDSALVETRKLNQKLYHYKFDAKRDYEQNPFAYYLAAMIWESDRKYDDAYIDYKKVYELFPQYAPIKEDLIRLSTLSQRPDELSKWKKQFPDVKFKNEWKDKKHGELVLIYQQGWGPRKRPDPASPRMPKLYPIYSHTDQANLVVEGVGEKKSEFLYSVEATAIKTLADQYAGLAAKRVAGIATKAVVADQLRQKNETLGQLAWIGMNLADRADTRQWSTLPETFQIARMYLPAGTYRVRVEGLTDSGKKSGEDMEAVELTVKAGKKAFMTWRSVR